MGAIPRPRKALAALLGLVLLAGTSSVALADGDHGNGEHGQHGRNEAHHRFTEVTGFMDLENSDDWAIPYITQLYLHGFVKGEGHGRFNPKASISQAQAVAMVVRAVYGGDDEALAASAKIAGDSDFDMMAWLDAHTDWNVTSIALSARWSLPYLVVAVHDGLISGQDSFSANEAADRVWSTELLVKAEVEMGILTQAQVSGADLSLLNRFSDVATLSADERTYLAAAVAAGLADGYPDHTFRPHASISRAEFTTLMARASEVQSTTVVQGTVTAVNVSNQTLTVQQGTGTSGSVGGSTYSTYLVASDVLIYVRVGDQFISGRDSTLSLANIQVGDQVTLHLGSDGKVALIYDEFQVKTVSGQVTSVTAPANTTTPYFVDVKTTAGLTYHFSVAPYATIYLKGQPSSMSVVKNGATVTVQYHGTEAVSIRVGGQAGDASEGTGDVGEEHGHVDIQGTVQEVKGSNAFTVLVNLEENDAVHVSVVYSVTTTDATRFEHANGVADLSAGDQVKVEGIADGYDLIATQVEIEESD